MTVETRKWFWTAVFSGVSSLIAMFAANVCAAEGAMLMAREAQAIADGATENSLDALKVAASQYALYSGILAAAGLALGALMVVAWAISHFKGERPVHVVPLALLLLLSLFFLVMV